MPSWATPPAADNQDSASVVAHRYPALHQALGEQRTGEPTIHDAATAAVENKGSGTAVNSSVAERVGAHLGADFTNVRVHSDPLAQQATAAMEARAFAYGSDVFLGPGESGSDVGLMAHELTHVVQQGAAGRQTPQRAVTVGDAGSPAEQQADKVAADVTSGQGKPAQLVVDAPPLAEGQMLKADFLGMLRAQVTAAADAELGPMFSAMGCPYIEEYFARYTGEPAVAGVALLHRFAPATRDVRAAAEMIPPVVLRVREGVRSWRETGQMPGELASMSLPGAEASSETAGQAQAQALRAPDGRETVASLEAELGAGQQLDGATASRMSEGLGIDVSSARIHTGPVAARKAAAADALAFAVGNNVVMGAGAPIAGTFEGDALLAHELAHTSQQADAASDPVARRRPIGSESSAAEDHADAAALGALERLHGGERRGLVQRLGTMLKTDLQLQRCAASRQSQLGRQPQLTSQQQASRSTLQRLSGLSEPDFRREVGAMTRQQTEELLNNIVPADQATYAELVSRIRNERLVSSTESLQGQLYWAGNSGADPNDSFRIRTRADARPRDNDLADRIPGNDYETNTNNFALWVRGGPEPTDTSKMNCWEAILYGGWKAGIITKSWIDEVHANAASNGQAASTEEPDQGAKAQSAGRIAYTKTIGSALGVASAARWTIGDSSPPRGNLVFFNGTKHVAISTGNAINGRSEIMSLWLLPTSGLGNFNSHMQRTTIEDIVAGFAGEYSLYSKSSTVAISHGPNPWR